MVFLYVCFHWRQNSRTNYKKYGFCYFVCFRYKIEIMITFGLENSFGLILSDITVGHSDSQPIREDFPSGWANQEPRRWRPKSARVHGNWVYFFAIQIIIANIVAKGGWVGFFYIAGWWKVGYFISSLNSGKKWLCGFFREWFLLLHWIWRNISLGDIIRAGAWRMTR